MQELMRRSRVLVVAAVVALSLSVFAGPAAAANGPEYVGGCNMLHGFHGDSSDVTRGMGRAMSVANANGATGMFHGLEASGCTLFTVG